MNYGERFLINNHVPSVGDDDYPPLGRDDDYPPLGRGRRLSPNINHKYQGVYYSCIPCKKFNVSTNRILNLIKNGHANWTKYETCDRTVEYVRK